MVFVTVLLISWEIRPSNEAVQSQSKVVLDFSFDEPTKIRNKFNLSVTTRESLVSAAITIQYFLQCVYAN